METEKTQWHSRAAEDVARALGTDLKTGLTGEEARTRLGRHGTNELAEQPRPTFLQLLVGQFSSFLVLILIVSAVISLVLGEIVEAGAIMAIVVLNAVLGVIQESKAEESLAALKKMAAPEAHVLRDGHRVTIPSSEVVPGDVVFLEAGNYVPADLRLMESVNLKVDEASLTGESVPVEKTAGVTLARDVPLGDRVNSAFMSTIVTYGRGMGIVADTGMGTQIGLIADMIQSYEEEPTPLQLRLDQLGRWLGWGSLIVCGVVFIEALIQDTNLSLIASQGVGSYLAQTRQQIVDLFIVAVSLAIAAVPEGLPAVVTINLALGMREMVQRHALIRRLPAVETLGSATVIGSDKTGTLTQNKMMAVQFQGANFRMYASGEGYEPEGEFTLREATDGGGMQSNGATNPLENTAMRRLLTGSLLCSDARLEQVESGNGDGLYRIVGDPTEGALVVAAAKAGLWREAAEAQRPRVAEVPFDSDRKRMSTIHRMNGQSREESDGSPYLAYVKGAPDVMLPLCSAVLEDNGAVPLTEARRDFFAHRIRDMGREGLRVLAVAYRPLDEVPDELSADELETELVLVGLVAMIDPARPEVGPAVKIAGDAGIRTVMITGDYPDTARAVAQEIGLLRANGQVLTGSELNDLPTERLVERIEDIDVFARVSPQHKVRIVEALKARGHVVAMTGDGVNDAPALKRSHIGVAMGITGTDVSKETADMVLTDDNYASIVSAVEQGRIIYSNIRKFVYYLISCNMAEIMVIFLATLLGSPPPLTAIQLLWLNLLTDGAPALALGLEKGDPDIMKREPRPVREPIINRTMRVGIVVQTIAITAVVLVAFYVGLRLDPTNLALARTMAFVTLSASELLRAYTARSERASLLELGILTNRYMQYAVAASIFLLLLVVYVPFLQPVFNTVPLGLREWQWVLPLLAVPGIVAEITKWIGQLRERPRRAVTQGS
jgi:Ca2+-transporting ATPase